MLSEPMTLYKLMNLYMLKQVNFPLTNAQLSGFFLDREYTTYFTLQQALNELLEAGLIKMQTLHNSTRYEITREGEETLEFFGKKISPAIVEDMDEYLKENRFRMRNEVGLVSDFYKSTNQDYIVHCEVREGKNVLVGIDVSVPDKEQAELTEKIEQYEQEGRTEHDQLDKIQDFIDEVSKYAGITELNYKILHQLIDKILVSKAEKVDGEYVQKIQIFYRFIGPLDAIE